MCKPVRVPITVISDEMTENEKKAAGDLKIAAVQQNAEMGNVLEASIQILPNTLPVGTSVGVRWRRSKKQYSECVPLEVLHQGGGRQVLYLYDQ